jgi:hypothetical protein
LTKKKEKKRNSPKQKQTNMSIYSSFCTLKHRKSGSPRRSRAWSPRILNRRQHRDTVITFSHCCSDFERSCNICNKTIKSKSPSGLNNNFHNHLKTHGLNAKEYKAWQTKNQLGRAQPSSAVGFGGDVGGGDFGGGFDDQDDRGAQDERFKDVPDEARDNDKRASGIDSSCPRWNSVALHATLWNERWRVQCTHRHRRAPKNSRAK